MGTGEGVLALSESFRDMVEGVQVLDALEKQFRSFGARHFLVTGLPLPGRPVEPLILRLSWGELRQDRGGLIDAGDPLLQRALRAERPFLIRSDFDDPALNELSLIVAARSVGANEVIGVPVKAFLPYQGLLLAAGSSLAVDTRSLLTLDHLGEEAFRRLFALGLVHPDRPGDLSARERKVVALSASGKTASEIAAILQISQRTVHAHLQNASEKLRAHNKTHTVVEALRYGQISV